MSENAVCAVAIFIFRRIFGAKILLHTLHHLLGISFDMLGSDIEYELRPLQVADHGQKCRGFVVLF